MTDWIYRRFWALFHWHRLDLHLYHKSYGDIQVTLSMWSRPWEEQKVKQFDETTTDLRAVGWEFRRDLY